MKLSQEHVGRLEAFLGKIKTETYPEPPSYGHSQITMEMVERLWKLCGFQPGAAVLDVGCGQGVAMKHFAERQCDVTGVTLNTVDAEVCRGLGYRVLEMDQSFLEFPEQSFDLVWCRHCLEHSVFPYFTLQGFHWVLKPGGWLYIEVPAPDTACNHQNNRNHYSVLGKTMLASLIVRSGFTLVETFDISSQAYIGPDVYWALLQQKK